MLLTLLPTGLGPQPCTQPYHLSLHRYLTDTKEDQNLGISAFMLSVDSLLP